MFFRYKHKVQNCYKVSKEFASFLSERLKGVFPTVFEQFEKIKEAEGCDGSEACIRMSSFTCFSIIQDYNSKPKVDKDNYNVGFIIWIQEG